MDNRDDSYQDRMLDQLAHLVIALAGVVVVAIAIGAGIVIVGAGSWSYATEVIFLFSLSAGTLVTLGWLVRLYRHRKEL